MMARAKICRKKSSKPVTLKIIALLCYALRMTFGAIESPHALHHFVFFDRDRERIEEKSFLTTKAFEGAQLKFTWRELEPEKDRYDFTALRHDLDFLTRRGKRLFVQLQDSS